MNPYFVNRNYFFYASVTLLVWTWSCFTGVSAEPDRTTQMRLVKEKILKNYDKFIRPTNGTSNTTEVYTAFIPRQIMDLDEEKAMLSLDSWIFMHWIDYRLRWNASDYEGNLQLPASMIWVPDVSVYNSHSLQVDPTQEVLLGFSNGGEVWWVPPLHTQTPCATVSKKPYPYEEIECEIQIGSWMHDGWEVDYQHSNSLIFSDMENINPNWELIVEKSTSNRNITYYEGYNEPYVFIQIKLALRRRPVPAIEATRASCIVIMVLTLTIFWLPPDSSKKILVGGFLFLAVNVLLVYVAWSTKGPQLVLSAVSFVQTTMYLVVITLLLQVIFVLKISSLYGPSRPPPAVMQILTSSIGRYACLPSLVDKFTLDRVQLKDDSSTSESFTARDEWKLLATAIDRGLFVIMFIVMIAVHHL